MRYRCRKVGALGLRVPGSSLLTFVASHSSEESPSTALCGVERNISGTQREEQKHELVFRSFKEKPVLSLQPRWSCVGAKWPLDA